jgi:hypothetical protein
VDVIDLAPSPEARRIALEEVIVKDDAEGLAGLLDHTAACAVDDHGMTLLMKAVVFGSLQCVELLLPLSDPNARDRHGFSILMWAAAKSNHRIVNALAPHCDLEYRDEAGWSAFMVVCKSKTFSTLLSHCDPAKRQGHASEALILAASDGRVAMVKHLLPIADCLFKDGSGRLARDYAKTEGHGAVVNLIDAHLARQERAALKRVLVTAPTPSGKRGAARL